MRTIKIIGNTIEILGSLGISPYRLADVAIVERLLPVAQQYDVMMALECHNPTNVAQECQQKHHTVEPVLQLLHGAFAFAICFYEDIHKFIKGTFLLSPFLC